MEGPHQSCPTPFPTRLGPGRAASPSTFPHGLEEATGLLEHDPGTSSFLSSLNPGNKDTASQSEDLTCSQIFTNPNSWGSILKWILNSQP